MICRPKYTSGSLVEVGPIGQMRFISNVCGNLFSNAPPPKKNSHMHPFAKKSSPWTTTATLAITFQTKLETGADELYPILPKIPRTRSDHYFAAILVPYNAFRNCDRPPSTPISLGGIIANCEVLGGPSMEINYR